MSASHWLDALRAACASTTQSDIARRIGYSVTVVNQVLKGTYNGDLSRIKAAVEGALMNAEVECPVAGLIPRQRCIEYQRMPFRPTNPANVQLYRACRGGCPHSLHSPTGHVPVAQPAVATTPAAGASAHSSPDVTPPTRRRKRPLFSNRNQQ